MGPFIADAIGAYVLRPSQPPRSFRPPTPEICRSSPTSEAQRQCRRAGLPGKNPAW